MLNKENCSRNVFRYKIDSFRYKIDINKDKLINNHIKSYIYISKTNKIPLQLDTINLLFKLSLKFNVSIDSILYVLCKNELKGLPTAQTNLNRVERG